MGSSGNSARVKIYASNDPSRAIGMYQMFPEESCGS